MLSPGPLAITICIITPGPHPLVNNTRATNTGKHLYLTPGPLTLVDIVQLGPNFKYKSNIWTKKELLNTFSPPPTTPHPHPPPQTC